MSQPDGGEVVLDPDLPICDPHHHLWEHPAPPYLPEGTYVLDEFRADARNGHNIVSSVYVEAGNHYRTDGPPELAPVGETEWIVSQSSDDGLLAGIVGFADMRLGDAVSELLHAHMAAGKGRFCGVRHGVAFDDHPDVWSGRQQSGTLMREPGFVDGVRAVGRADLTYETWCYFHQLPMVLELVRQVPDTPVLIDHLGGPAGVGPYAARRAEVEEELRRSLGELAQHENVWLKLGGVGMAVYGPDFPGDPSRVTGADVADRWGDLIRWCIEAFGPERCMFESNFPVDATSCTYRALWNGFKLITRDCSPWEKALLFHDTATRFYGLGR